MPLVAVAVLLSCSTRGTPPQTNVPSASTATESTAAFEALRRKAYRFDEAGASLLFTGRVQLEVGMTVEDVVARLGQPELVRPAGASTTRWYYGFDSESGSMRAIDSYRVGSETVAEPDRAFCIDFREGKTISFGIADMGSCRYFDPAIFQETFGQ